MKETQFIDDKVLRDKSVEHYEVLEKVKELLLIPNTKWATQKQVSEYYEVGEKAIETIYSRHRDELESDGVSLKSYKEFLNIQNELPRCICDGNCLILSSSKKVVFIKIGVMNMP